MEQSYYQTRWADDAVEWRARARRELAIELWLRHGDPPARPADVLDVGCGTGLLLRDLASHGRAVGIDVGETAVAFCRARGLARTLVASGEALPFRDGSFDLVTMIEVLEHLADDRSALADAGRVLRPGGALVLTVPAFPFLWSPRDVSLRHRRRYVLGELRRKVEGAGLRVAFLSYVDAWLLPPLVAMFAAHRLFPRRVDLKLETVAAPRPLNALLLAASRLERRALARALPPFGVSLACVARRE